MKKLDRELGLFSVIAISLGAMLGPGIFVLPGLAASISGPGLFYAYILAGLIVLPAALSKAEMSTAIPESGGPYLFLDRTLGPLAGTISGLGTWLSLILKAAFSLFGISLYLTFLSGIPGWLTSFIAAGVGLCLVLLNSFGAKKAGQIQNVLVGVTVLTLLTFIGRGSIEVNNAHFQTLFPGGTTGFLVGTGFLAVSYVGVIKIASVAEEIKQPESNIPWGIVVSMIIAVLLYSSVAFVLAGVVPFDQLGSGEHRYTPLIQASLPVLGKTGGYIIGVVGVLAMTSMANAGLMAASRFPLPMAREHILPELLGTINERFSTPIYSIMLTGGILIGFVLFLPVKDIAKLASAFLLLLFTMSNVAVLIFRESGVEWYKPDFQSPFYPFLPLVGALSSFALLVYLCWIPIMGFTPLIGTSLLIGLCGLWYYSFVRRKTDRTGMLFQDKTEIEELEIFNQARSRSETWKKSVIVPFFELDEITMAVERRIRIAAALCTRNERLDIVNFREVPEQSFLSSFKTDNEILNGLRERVKMLRSELDHEIHLDEVITHHSRRALKNYAEQEQPHWIVLNWYEPTFLSGWFGWKQWWIETFPCDLMLFEDREQIQISQIIVIAEPGPYDGEIINAADQIARDFDSEVTFLLPVSIPEKEDSFLEDYESQLRTMCGSSTVVRVDNEQWEEEIIEHANEADLLLFGGVTKTTTSGFPTTEQLLNVSDEVECSVARIQSSLRSPKLVTPQTTSEKTEFTKYLSPNHIQVDVDANGKEELFHRLASLFSTAHLPTSEVEEALWERERMSDTHIGEGFALPHAILETAETTKVALISLHAPIEYAEYGERVQHVAATIGPASERNRHLEIISQLSEFLLHIDPESLFQPDRDPEEIKSMIVEQVSQ